MKHPFTVTDPPRWVWGMCAMVLGAGATQSLAQSTAPVNGIYTCTDAQGRKLRSDRPIAACLDREQTVLNPSGTVRARVGPALSARQRAALEERRKEEATERARILEDKRRDRAILTRYPTRAAHDKERANAHARLDAVVMEAEKRIVALQDERKKVNRELEFYKGDPAKAPPAIQRQIDFISQGLQAQQRFIQAQQNERQRVDVRFDEELARLIELWQEQKSVGGVTPRALVGP